MPSENHLQAWDSYRTALTGLYQQNVEALIATPEPTEVAVPEGPALDQALESSERLEEALTQQLESDDPSSRQLAEMKLAAAASVDAGVAADLLRQAEAPEVETLIANAEGELSSLSFTIPEADPVLSATALHEVPGLAGESPNGNAQAEAVEKAIEKTVADIRDDATSGSDEAISGLVATGVPLSGALGSVSQELIGNLGGKIGPIVHKGLEFLKKAIDKLLGLLGGKVSKAISDKLASWLDDLKDGKMTAGILERVWGTDEIEEEIKKELAAAGPKLTEDRAGRAVEELERLDKAFDKQAGFVRKVLKVVKFVAPAIAALQPAGPIFLAAGYGAALLFLTLAGADYVDWKRAEIDGFFDRVEGVRHVVATAVG